MQLLFGVHFPIGAEGPLEQLTKTRAIQWKVAAAIYVAALITAKDVPGRIKTRPHH